MRAHACAAVLFLALPGAVLVPAENASAQQGRRAGGQDQSMRFAGMDRNGDGVITRREWNGSDESFRVHDWNDDGVLSGAEVRPGAQRPGRAARDYDPAARGEFSDWSEGTFADLDHNRDGRLSRDEWHFDVEAFRRADRNRDGALTRAEFLGHDMDDDRDDRFRHLDANRNGRIERGEWHGSADAFEWLDRDNDGVLSRLEMVGESEADDVDAFRSLDSNRNGVISRNEWHWSRDSFERLDRNRDGVLTTQEFAASEAQAGTAGSMTEVTIDPSLRWTETGLFLRAGDVVVIEASGTVQLSTNSADVADAGGARSGRRAAEAPLQAQAAGALIARIGESAPVLVGSRTTIRAPAGGQLYLGVNDDHLADNTGEFRARIAVQERGR